jgi:hypothetical protein
VGLAIVDIVAPIVRYGEFLGWDGLLTSDMDHVTVLEFQMEGSPKATGGKSSDEVDGGFGRGGEVRGGAIHAMPPMENWIESSM